MEKKEVFYTEEQKKILKELSLSKSAHQFPASRAECAMILDALGEQQNTLQNIECILQRIEEAILLEKRIQ